MQSLARGAAFLENGAPNRDSTHVINGSEPAEKSKPDKCMSIRIETIEQLSAMIPNTALEPLGVDVIDADEDHLTLRLQITDKTLQPLGLLHGGISMLLAESAASMHACWGIDISKMVPVGIEVSGSHIRSASDGSVLAKATLVRKSLSLAVHTVEIASEQTGRVLCVARITNFYKQRNQPA